MGSSRQGGDSPNRFSANGIVDLSKPRVRTVGDMLDETAKAPMFTPEDIRYAQPLGDKVFVQPQQPAKRTKGGVLLPDEQQPVPTEGVVVAVGPGDHAYNGVLVPVRLKVGDRVKFVAQAFGGGITITGFDNHDRFVLVMREPDVFCVFPSAADEPDGEFQDAGAAI